MGYGNELPIEEPEQSVDVPRRIHILGTGSIGLLVAHSLRNLSNPPPVSLIMHTVKRWKAWQDGPQEITLTTEGIPVARGGFDVELMKAGFRRHGRFISKEEFLNSKNDHQEEVLDRTEQMAFRSDNVSYEQEGYVPPGAEDNEPIHNLVLTTKAHQSVGALFKLRHRLSPDSSILILQNGMGLIDELDKEVFPNLSTRPNYLVGINSHGAYVEKWPNAVHAGLGTISIGVLPSRSPKTGRSDAPPSDAMTAATSRYLLRTICRSPVLAAVALSPTDLMQAQLEKLAVNAIINPITALVDGRNGVMNHNFYLTRATRLLLSEISLVIRSLPEVKHIPNVATRFSTERLETLAVGIAHKTRNNISSTLADVRDGKQSEIEYINGYIVKRGEELGIACYMNYLVTQLVEGKRQMISLEKQDELPVFE